MPPLAHYEELPEWQRAKGAVGFLCVPSLWQFSLSMNGAKTMDMVISARREDNIPSPPSPIISGQSIRRVSTFKLLWVQISSDLSQDAHIKDMLSKTRTRIHYLSVAKRAGLPCDVLKLIYLSFICPILKYARPVWGGLTKGLSKELERVHERCCRTIGSPSSSLSSLSERRDEATVHPHQHTQRQIHPPCTVSCLQPQHSLTRFVGAGNL